ncbi:MAG: hypothetical protein KTR30_22475 [Saprospiraceae bacterium]|nr:hypothetical protein [Saprospiraceae bacterium]
MNKQNLTTLLVFLFLGSGAWAQGDPLYNTNNEVFTEKRYSKVQGSPYFNKEWNKGNLYDIKDKVLPHASINYNGETGLMEIKEEEKTIQLNQNLYNRVEIMVEGKKQVFVNRITPVDLTYYRAVYQSDIMQFLEKFQSTLKEEEVATYGASKSRSKFVNKTKFYIFRDGKMEEVNRNTKKLVEHLKSARLKGYVKKNKLNLKKDEDLVKALAYYESSMMKNK